MEIKAQIVGFISGSTTGLLRIIRGGSWFSGADDCHVAQRTNYALGYRPNGIGFRVVF